MRTLFHKAKTWFHLSPTLLSDGNYHYCQVLKSKIKGYSDFEDWRMWINTDPYESQKRQMSVHLILIQPQFSASRCLWAWTVQVKERGLEFQLWEQQWCDLGQVMIKWHRAYVKRGKLSENGRYYNFPVTKSSAGQDLEQAEISLFSEEPKSILIPLTIILRGNINYSVTDFSNLNITQIIWFPHSLSLNLLLVSLFLNMMNRF